MLCSCITYMEIMKPKQKAIELHEQSCQILGYDNDNSAIYNRALSIMAEYVAYKISQEVIEEIMQYADDTVTAIERINYWESVQKHINKL